MQRYDSDNPTNLHVAPLGSWVLYDDHIAEIRKAYKKGILNGLDSEVFNMDTSMKKIKVMITWISGDIGYGRNIEYGDFCLEKEHVAGKKLGDIIEVEVIGFAKPTPSPRYARHTFL